MEKIVEYYSSKGYIIKKVILPDGKVDFKIVPYVHQPAKPITPPKGNPPPPPPAGK
jgi:hypothetical protein